MYCSVGREEEEVNDLAAVKAARRSGRESRGGLNHLGGGRSACKHGGCMEIERVVRRVESERGKAVALRCERERGILFWYVRWLDDFGLFWKFPSAAWLEMCSLVGREYEVAV